jgi:hypothetical protein
MSLPLPNVLTISRLDACRCHSPLHRREEPFVDDRHRVASHSNTILAPAPYVAVSKQRSAGTSEKAGAHPCCITAASVVTSILDKEK